MGQVRSKSSSILYLAELALRGVPSFFGNFGSGLCVFPSLEKCLLQKLWEGRSVVLVASRTMPETLPNMMVSHGTNRETRRYFATAVWATASRGLRRSG